MISDIKVVKLVSGEELVAEVEERINVVVIKNPVVILVMEKSIALMPWVRYVDTKVFEVDKSHVLFMGAPIVDIVNIYNQKYGSGLVI